VRKLIEDLEARYEGARIVVGEYRGAFVSMTKPTPGWGLVTLTGETGTRFTVLRLLTTYVELTPLPELKEHDKVLRSAFFRAGSRFYRVWSVGEVKAITKDSRQRIVYGIEWEGNLDVSYHLRSGLEKLDQETRDAALAFLTEQKEQNA
jgi:hypothetical protein